MLRVTGLHLIRLTRYNAVSGSDNILFALFNPFTAPGSRFIKVVPLSLHHDGRQTKGDSSKHFEILVPRACISHDERGGVG
jgi:hypothetical protein